MNEEQFVEQIKEIKRINNKLKKDFIKTGTEVDIMADGSLDLKDELLEQLDWVCASIHSGFTHDNTERIIAACQNKFVNCIGHPAGRTHWSAGSLSCELGKGFRNSQTNRIPHSRSIARLIAWI